MPACVRNQNAALPAGRWGEGNKTSWMTPIHPNSPTSKADSAKKSALAASLSPSPTASRRIGAMTKYWDKIP
jgi:hypothetical protein